MTDHRIIYDGYWTNNLRGVAFTKYNMIRLRSHNSYKNCQIKIAGYDQLHIMPIHPTKYERNRTNDLRGVSFTKGSGTDKPKSIPPYYRMQGIKMLRSDTSRKLGEEQWYKNVWIDLVKKVFKLVLWGKSGFI